MDINIEQYLQIAIEASIKAGNEILTVYHQDHFGVEIKDDESPLTLADIRSNNEICAYLKGTPFPVLSEEGREIAYNERKQWEILWIVDPLDGTKEFIKRNGEFTVNIALIHKHSPLLGVVYAPVTGELYFAGQDFGSYKITLKDKSVLPLSELVERADSLPMEIPEKKYTVVASRSHLSDETIEYIEKLKKKHGEVESLSRGSSLKLCMVAEGAADCYPRFAPTMEWDTAAGHAICKFSGAEVTDKQTGKELRYNRENLRNNWFLVHRPDQSS